MEKKNDLKCSIFNEVEWMHIECSKRDARCERMKKHKKGEKEILLHFFVIVWFASRKNMIMTTFRSKNMNRILYITLSEHSRVGHKNDWRQ